MTGIVNGNFNIVKFDSLSYFMGRKGAFPHVH